MSTTPIGPDDPIPGSDPAEVDPDVAPHIDEPPDPVPDPGEIAPH